MTASIRLIAALLPRCKQQQREKLLLLRHHGRISSIEFNSHRVNIDSQRSRSFSTLSNDNNNNNNNNSSSSTSSGNNNTAMNPPKRQVNRALNVPFEEHLKSATTLHRGQKQQQRPSSPIVMEAQQGDDSRLESNTPATASKVYFESATSSFRRARLEARGKNKGGSVVATQSATEQFRRTRHAAAVAAATPPATQQTNNDPTTAMAGNEEMVLPKRQTPFPSSVSLPLDSKDGDTIPPLPSLQQQRAMAQEEQPLNTQQQQQEEEGSEASGVNESSSSRKASWGPLFTGTVVVLGGGGVTVWHFGIDSILSMIPPV